MRSQSANTANKATKLEARVARNTEQLAAKQERAGTAASVTTNAADKAWDRCHTGTCK